MKKYLALILSILMVLCLCACKNGDDESSSLPELESSSSSSEVQSERGEGKLVIDGIESDASFIIYQTYAELPLVPILEGMGYTVNWINDTEATITYNSKSFTLNLSTKSLIETGNTKNIIPQYGNDNYKCEVKGKGIIVDDVSLYDIMYSLGTPIKLSLDYDTLTVTITKK